MGACSNEFKALALSNTDMGVNRRLNTFLKTMMAMMMMMMTWLPRPLKCLKCPSDHILE